MQDIELARKRNSNQLLAELPKVNAVAKHIYIAPLDGLRAIAILLVLSHMGGFRPTVDNESLLGQLLAITMDGGWVGVQLFFVISGFLITRILLKTESDDTRISFINFYIRRSLRIFPIYYASLAILFCFALILSAPPPWLSNSYTHKFWFLLYMNNWITPFVDPFIGHYWSLAVEEQFYLLWPLLVLKGNRKLLVWACCILIVQAPIFRYAMTAWFPQHAELTAYTWTPARLDGLLIGALLAIARQEPQLAKNLNIIAGVMGAIALLYIAIVLKTHYLFQPATNDWTILNQTGCALLFASIIHFCMDNTNTLNSRATKIAGWMQQLLSGKALRSIGKYSYAIYIFHFPISKLLHTYAYPIIDPYFETFHFSGVNLTFFIEFILLILTTYLAARLSWIIIEHPFLKLKARWPI